MRFFVTEPSNIWGISCDQFSWRLSNAATGQTFYIQGRSTVEELQEMLNNRIELVEAAQAVCEWADELGYYAEGGTQLAPVFTLLKTAMSKARGETK
jgi:hypothetical protein